MSCAASALASAVSDVLVLVVGGLAVGQVMVPGSLPVIRYAVTASSTQRLGLVSASSEKAIACVPSLVTVIRSKPSVFAMTLAVGSGVWMSPSVLTTRPRG